MGLFSKTNEGASDEIVVSCGTVLDISHSLDFHEELKLALGKGGIIVLDGAEIEKVDASALQLCAAFFHDASARKVQAKWRSPSIPLIRAAALLGLSEPLGLPNSN